MSDENELEQLRRQRMAEIRQQQLNSQVRGEQAQREAQQNALNAQKRMLLLQILNSEALSRLANIRLARPEFAEAIEMQLIQAYQMQSLPQPLPLTDAMFKQILIKIQNHLGQREQKISFR